MRALLRKSSAFSYTRKPLPFPRHDDDIPGLVDIQDGQLREYGPRRVIEDILIQKEEHKRDLLTVLESWKRS